MGDHHRFVMPAAILGAALAACAAPGREAAWEKGAAAPSVTTASAGADVATLLAEARAHFGKRDDKAELEAAIATWEKAAQADAKDPTSMVHLARAHYFLVDGHLSIEDAPKEAQLERYRNGVDWGEKALVLLDPGFEQAMRAGAKFEEAIKKIEKPAIAATYWYSTNLGRFANLTGIKAQLFYKDRIRAAMERIHELDPSFFYAGADRYFGAFFSALPSVAGKDLDKSKIHFEQSKNAAPEYLQTRVLEAQFLAVELDDSARYTELLNEVLAAQEGDNPDCAPENRAAKRAAKKMLASIDEIF